MISLILGDEIAKYICPMSEERFFLYNIFFDEQKRY